MKTQTYEMKFPIIYIDITHDGECLIALTRRNPRYLQVEIHDLLHEGFVLNYIAPIGGYEDSMPIANEVV